MAELNISVKELVRSVLDQIDEAIRDHPRVPSWPARGDNMKGDVNVIDHDIIEYVEFDLAVEASPSQQGWKIRVLEMFKLDASKKGGVTESNRVRFRIPYCLHVSPSARQRQEKTGNA